MDWGLRVLCKRAENGIEKLPTKGLNQYVAVKQEARRRVFATAKFGQGIAEKMQSSRSLQYFLTRRAIYRRKGFQKIQ
ncbi:hypothetical protein Plhal304r1_c019g0069571 [Plasmopara halstedii]